MHQKYIAFSQNLRTFMKERDEQDDCKNIEQLKQEQ